MFNSDNTAVGYYTLALTITSPLSTLPAIIGTTYFKQFATQESIPRKVIIYTVLLTLLSCIAFILMVKPIVSFLYPDSYQQVGVYASFLALGFSVHGLGDMINRFLGSHGEGRMIRNASIVNGIVKVIGFIVLVYFFNIIGAILTVVLCDFIYTAMLIYYYLRFIYVQNKIKSRL